MSLGFDTNTDLVEDPYEPIAEESPKVETESCNRSKTERIRYGLNLVASGVSQRQAAKQAGISRITLSKYDGQFECAYVCIQ